MYYSSSSFHSDIVLWNECVGMDYFLEDLELRSYCAIGTYMVRGLFCSIPWGSFGYPFRLTHLEWNSGILFHYFLLLFLVKHTVLSVLRTITKA